MYSIPSPITQSAAEESPNGARSAARTPAGITSIPIAGTARMFASSPNCDMMLKWKAEIGAVASPATSEVAVTPTIGRRNRQRRSCCVSRHQALRRSHSKAATSAVVAAKDIWNPASVRLSGRRTRMMSAASATARRVSAGRSRSTATSTTAVMMKARWVATLAPDSAR